jgi:Mg-chelatase subunit ChlD
MSFLYPLFLAGSAAVALPLYLHLRRRRTSRELPFGSLMFLGATPIRFESRRRLEHVALLVLRVLALAALALAFARPYTGRSMMGGAGAGERLVVLLDVSASMRREALFGEALGHVRGLIGKAGDQDRVALLTFDRGTRALLGFDEWAAAPAGDRAAKAEARLVGLQPGWGATDLGRALQAAADALADDEAADAEAKRPPAARRRVVLVSDLQQGARLDGPVGRELPAGVVLEALAVQARATTNVSATWLEGMGDEASGGDGTAAAARPASRGATTPRAALRRGRVRLASAAGGAEKRVRLRWERGGASAADAAPEQELAPGTARVIDVAPPPDEDTGTGAGAGATLVLEGDGQDFDNRVFVAPPLAVKALVLFLGEAAAAGETPGLHYFLARAFPQTPLRDVTVEARAPEAADAAARVALADLVVVGAPLPPALRAAVGTQVERGRLALVTLDGRMGDTAGALIGRTPLRFEVAPPGKFAILGEVDLGHPWLAAFDDPRFSDWSKIRFWQRVRLADAAVPGATILARFDDGDVALAAAPRGKGHVVLLAAGWRPVQSQLALSSKFAPLCNALLDASAGLGAGLVQHVVGDTMPLPGSSGAALTLRAPDGARTPIAAGATVLHPLARPGLYALEDAADPTRRRVFAVNLAPAESQVAPRPAELFEIASAAGSARAEPARSVVTLERAAAREREGQQKAWRWVMLAGLLVLVLETLLGARMTRRISPQAKEASA